MSRNTKIVVAVTAVLIFAAAALAWLNQDSIKKAMPENGTFLVTAGGRQYTVSISDFETMGPYTIDANYKTNGRAPVQKQYTGVSLKRLFDHLGVDDSAAARVRFTAADGYTSALSLSDALDEENCFIVFEENGRPLGTRDSGGSGLYMMILAKDRFSRRWCKYLLEIAVS